MSRTDQQQGCRRRYRSDRRCAGRTKFFAIETSEAIAQKYPRYGSDEIPLGIIASSPARPDDKVETLSVDHLLVARKALPEASVTAFTKQLFAARQSLASLTGGRARLRKPDTDKDAEMPVPRGAAAFIDGNERSFLDKYSDYFWFVLLGLSGLGSAVAWFRQFLKRDERELTTSHRNQIMAAVGEVRASSSVEEFRAMQTEVDSIVEEAVQFYDDGALDDADLTTLGLALGLFHLAVARRTEELAMSVRPTSVKPHPAPMRTAGNP